MSVLFAYQFEVDPRPGQAARHCLGAIRDLVAAWVSGSYGRRGSNQLRFPFDGTTLTPGTGHEIRTSQQDCTTHQLTTLDWEYPNEVPPKGVWRQEALLPHQQPPYEEAAPSVWQFSCLLACDARTVQVALVAAAAADGATLRPISTQVDRTNHLSTFRLQILEVLIDGWHCRTGRQPILPGRIPTPKVGGRLADADGSAAVHGGGGASRMFDDPVQAFVETVLLSPERTLPIVMVGESDELVQAVPTAFGDRHPDAVQRRPVWSLTPPEGTPDSGGGSEKLSSPAVQQPLRGVWTFHGYLQARLLGLAQVAVVGRSGATRLEELLGRDRMVGLPGIRVYWPGLTRTTPPGECPAYGIADLVRLVQEPDPRPDQPLLTTIDKSLHHQFRSLSGECFREGRLIWAARAALAVEAVARERAAASTAARVADAEAEAGEARHARERLRRERDALHRELDAARRELAGVRAELLALREQSPEKDDEFAAELERVWDENDGLRVEVEAGRRRVAGLQESLRAAQANLTRQWQLPAEEPPTLPADERTFATVADALAAAATENADVLTVWEDARRSAEASLFGSPDQVYRALVAITEVGRDYFSARAGGPSPGPLERAFQRRVPYKYAGFESQTTLSMYGEDRVFRHAGVSRQMQRHLTLGGGDTNNCLQIYFEFDDAARKVLIGYCGRHLRYAGQRT